MTDHHTPRRRRWPWMVSAAVVVAVVGGFGAAALLGAFAPPEPVAAPAPTRTVEPTPEPTPTPEPAPEPAPPVIDIPSTQKMPYTPVWDPPDGGEHFWQIVDPEHGYPEDSGTDYVLAHACESQQCAGDQLRQLDEGAALTYLGDTYVVERKLSIMKTDIAAQDIWEHDPNRLVIITCIIETTWDASDKNEIVVATRAVA